MQYSIFNNEEVFSNLLTTVYHHRLLMKFCGDIQYTLLLLKQNPCGYQPPATFVVFKYLKLQLEYYFCFPMNFSGLGNCRPWKHQWALGLPVRLPPFRNAADKEPRKLQANWASLCSTFLLTVSQAGCFYL